MVGVSGTDVVGVDDFGLDFFGLAFTGRDFAFFLTIRLAFFFALFFVFRLTIRCTD
jgi:hypothetical protein